MKLKILGIEENVNSINDIKKYVKNSKIYQINIPHKNNFLMDKNDLEYFESVRRSVLRRILAVIEAQLNI